MDRTALSRMIRDSAPARVRDYLEANASPAVRIETTPAKESLLKPGQSRIGGAPDLPRGLEWPLRKGKPLSFIAQIAMEDVRPHDAEGALPAGGHLYFFYDALAQPWGFDPKDRGAWAVFHSVDVPLVRTPCPAALKDGGEFSLCSLRVASAWTFPDLSVNRAGGPDLSDEDYDACEEFLGKVDRACGLGELRHQLLGAAAPVQGEMELECQLVSHGIYCGDSGGDPRTPGLTPGAADWRLLFQVDSDDAAAMMWGDLGRVYFWIRKQDLATRNFGSVWTVLQCS